MFEATPKVSKVKKITTKTPMVISHAKLKEGKKFPPKKVKKVFPGSSELNKNLMPGEDEEERMELVIAESDGGERGVGGERGSERGGGIATSVVFSKLPLAMHQLQREVITPSFVSESYFTDCNNSEANTDIKEEKKPWMEEQKEDAKCTGNEDNEKFSPMEGDEITPLKNDTSSPSPSISNLVEGKYHLNSDEKYPKKAMKKSPKYSSPTDNQFENHRKEAAKTMKMRANETKYLEVRCFFNLLSSSLFPPPSFPSLMLLPSLVSLNLPAFPRPLFTFLFSFPSLSPSVSPSRPLSTSILPSSLPLTSLHPAPPLGMSSPRSPSYAK
jgi:hypothetical protein